MWSKRNRGIDESELRRTHTQRAIEERIRATTQHSYLGDFVLGAVDGAVTTFAIVAGAAGAQLSNGVALVLGAANVLADGFSMAASNFLKARSDQQIVDRFRRMEEMHIDRIPDAEREEIRQIFAAKGFQGETLESIVQIITNDHKRWVDTMLTEEWGLRLDSPMAWRSGVATFIAFLAAGLVPLAPLLFGLEQPVQKSFAYSSLLTAITFFMIGYVRGKTVDQNPFRTGLETVFIGGSAAALAYIVGRFLHGLAVG